MITIPKLSIYIYIIECFMKAKELRWLLEYISDNVEILVAWEDGMNKIYFSNAFHNPRKDWSEGRMVSIMLYTVPESRADELFAIPDNLEC